MNMRAVRTFCIAALMLSPRPAAAARPAVDRGAQQPSKAQLESIDKMLQRCRAHNEQSIKAIDAIAEAAQEARSSGDLEQMREQLGRIEAPLAALKGHTTGCTEMIDLAEERHRTIQRAAGQAGG